MFWISAFVTDVGRLAVFKKKPQHTKCFVSYKLIRTECYVKC